MKEFLKSDKTVIAAIGLLLFIVVLITRPPLPVDETRYLTVAWEMWLRGDWLAPLTMNYEAYHHKPPMLFWMMNACWEVFGVSRWAATLPIVLMAFANLYLIGRIQRHLFPGEEKITPWIMLGSVPFLVYATLILFDLSVCVFVQLAILCLLNFSKSAQTRWMVGLGIVLGLGVLTKGPVAYLYIAFPALFGPFWTTGIPKKKWYLHVLLSVIISIPIVMAWLGPVLLKSSRETGMWLLWNQTAGRVTGNMNAAHVRPFYFYLMLLPGLGLPWMFFRPFWDGWKNLDKNDRGLRLLFLWFVPTLVVFSLISGKQPHYLIPIYPAVLIVISHFLQGVPVSAIKNTVYAAVAILIAIHLVAYKTKFPKYDWSEVANYIQPYKERPMAFASNYHGELGFTARLLENHQVEDVQKEDLSAWFEKHPDGIAIIRYKSDDQVKDYKFLYGHKYRSKNVGVFERGMEP